MTLSDDEQDVNWRSPSITTVNRHAAANPSGTLSTTAPEERPAYADEVLSPLFVSAEADRDLAEIGKSFSKQNHIKVLAQLPHQSSALQGLILNNQDPAKLEKLLKQSVFLACFVNRFLMKPGESDVPKDKKRLRITRPTFKCLLSGLDASPCFVSSMLSTDALVRLGTRTISYSKEDSVLTFWYTLPVRTTVPCFDGEGNHALSALGSNQMDPNGYLHLGDIVHDIRPSKIGVYSRYDAGSCKMILIDFQDGRLHEIAEEPFKKIREVSQRSSHYVSLRPHPALISIAVRWWSHTLAQLKRQLIHYEMHLLEESMQRLASPELDLESSARHLVMKKTLHSVMSHLQRYNTELQVTKAIVSDLNIVSQSLGRMKQPNPPHEPARSKRDVDENLTVLAQQISALETFRQELETKTTTVMELLSDVVKSRNDMLLVNNGSLVRKLLKSARKQSKSSQGMMIESQKMARDMRKDSVSMKTIALLTLAFLPATSIAAIISMPFFSQQKWLNDPVKVWIWVAVTFPVTAVSAFVYVAFTKKELRTSSRSSQDEEEDEMESIDLELDD